MLVLAHPLHAHGLAHGAREEGRVRRRVVVAVHAVAARAVEIDEADLVLGQSEDAREGATVLVGRLRGGPDRGAVGGHVGNGTGRPHRGVALHRPEIARGEAALGAREGRRGIAALGDGLVVVDRTRAHVLLEALAPRQPLPLAPARLERLGGTDGGPLVLRDDAEEILDAHRARAGNAGERGLVERDEMCCHRGRADGAAVQHAGHAEVVDIDVPSRAFRRQVRARQRLADHPVGRGRLERGLGVDLERQAPALENLAEVEAPATRHHARLAVGDDELVHGHAELRGGELEECRPRGRRRLTDGHAAAGDARAAAGRALVGGQRRVALDKGDARDREVELLRHHLADGDPQAGAEVDLAGEDGDRAVVMDGEEA